MRTVYADTGYWQAMLNPRDDLHEKAVSITRSLSPLHIVTSEMVLAELLNYFASRGSDLRIAATKASEAISADPNITVVPQTRDLFRRAVERYKARPDKNWSLTDCASFLIMEERGIKEALAHDHDFKQAGFRVLLQDPGSQ